MSHKEFKIKLNLRVHLHFEKVGTEISQLILKDVFTL
jgi:hypothetical protein